MHKSKFHGAFVLNLRRDICSIAWWCRTRLTWLICTGKKAGQVCALKVMRESQARTQRDRETLVREAHFLCRMRSPHVLRSLGVSETVDKLPCLLRESVRNLPAAFGV